MVQYALRFLVQMRLVRSTLDVCLYTYQRVHHLLWVIVWVDDFIMIADKNSSVSKPFVNGFE